MKTQLTAFLLLLSPVIFNHLYAQCSSISGHVFADVSSDGIQNGIEAGLYGVIAIAFDENNIEQGRDTTDFNGDYLISGLSPGAYRVEFRWTLDWVESGVYNNGGSSGTSVQFIDAAPCTANLALQDPEDYCQPFPEMAITCFVNGNPLGGGDAGTADWVTQIPYLPSAEDGLNTYIADGTTLGAAWGLGFQRTTNTLITGAIMKRHSGFGVLGPGGVYTIDLNAGPATVTPLFDFQADFGISAGVDPRMAGSLSDNSADPNHDPNAFDWVGKMAIGDVDLSRDERTLWVMNIFNKTLYEIFVDLPVVKPGPGDLTAHPLPDPGCTNGEFRPWAIELHRNMVYVGGVCSAENGGTAADLHAYIYVHDPAGPDGNFTPVFDFPLDYPRAYISNAGGSNNVDAEWRPWIDDWNDITDPLPNEGPWAQTMYPQPILSDIEIDLDESIIVGIMDRFGNQSGNRNYGPDSSDKTTYEGVSAGDVLRICYDSGTYTLENNANCGAITTNGANSSPGQGPGGGEYYWQDMYRLSGDKNSGGHNEITLGGFAFVPGTGQLAITAYDPVDDYRAGGVIWFDNFTGERTQSYQIFELDFLGQPSTFGKATGLGDIAVLCSPAPLEIGNYVWVDTDGDGIQDPGEMPIQNVEVNLYIEDPDSPGSYILIGTTVTNSDGYYGFNNSNVDMNGVSPSTGNPTSGSYTGLDPYTDYFVTINDPTDFNLVDNTLNYAGTVLQVTTTDANGGIPGTLEDIRDSDQVLISLPGAPFDGYPTIPVSTEGPGENDHTLDFGFNPSCRKVEAISLSPISVCSSEGTTSITVTHQEDSGDFSLIYHTSPLTAIQLYGGSGTVINPAVTPTPGSTFTVVNGISFPQNTGSSPDIYYVYAILAAGNPNISVPDCIPAVVTQVVVNPETPTAMLLNTGEVCSQDTGSMANVIDLSTLIISGDMSGVWSDDDGTGGLVGSIFTASPGMVGNVYQFTYTIPGFGPDNTLCDSQPYTVAISVKDCPCSSGALYLCTGETATLTAEAGSVNVNWYKDGDTTMVYASGNVLMTAEFGSYHYTAQNMDGCDIELICPVQLFDGTTSAVLIDMDTVCNVNLGAADNSIDLSDLVIFGDMSGTWDDTDATGALSGSVFTASNGMEGNTYTFTYQLAGSGVCMPVNYPVMITVEDCSCPILNSMTGPSDICFSETFSLFIDHTLDPGPLAVYYNTGAVLTDTDLYSVGNGGALPVEVPLAASGTFSLVNGLTFSAGTYNFYAILDSSNPEYTPPSCQPMATTTITILGGTEPVFFSEPPPVCNIDLGGGDNMIDLNSLITSGPLTGTWNDDDATGGLSGSVFTASVLGTYNFTYTVPGVEGPGSGDCNDKSYLVQIEVVDCTCPGITNVLLPLAVCSDETFGITIEHTANSGDLAVYYATSFILPADLYSPGNGGAIQMGGDISPALNSTSTMINVNLPPNTSESGDFYLIYVGLANGNGFINDPLCLPLYETDIVVQPQTPTAIVSPAGNVCELNFGSSENAIDLADLITGGTGDYTVGYWTDDDNTGALSGSVFTADISMAGNTYQFTYTIPALPGANTCNDNMYTVSITVDVCTIPCPILSNLAGPPTVCSDDIFDVTVDHDGAIGDFDVYYSEGTLLGDFEFYNIAFSGFRTQLLDAFPSTGMSTVIPITLPPNIDTIPNDIYIYVVLDEANPNYVDPFCRPIISFNLQQGNVTPTATITPNDTLCSIPGGIYPDTIDLDTLITAGFVGGIWNDDDGTGALSGSVFTADVSMGGMSYNFTYTIPGVYGPGASSCNDQLYTVTIDVQSCLYDWGDLPDTATGAAPNDYETSQANNGPSHQIVPGLYIGATVDNETDGQPSGDALGDGADEDGIILGPNMDIVPGTTLNIPLEIVNTTGSTAYFEAWIDWNGDGDFDEPGEMVADLDDGTTSFPDYLTITVPAGATQDQLLGVRLRLSNQDNMTPYGEVNSGEIEDYLIEVECPQPVCLPTAVMLKKQLLSN